MTPDFANNHPNPEREARILDAATQLIVRYGYDKTTVSDVAREAGVSKGAIYLHYNSKEDVFVAAMEREMQRYATDFIARLQADPDAGSFGSIFKHVLGAMQNNALITALYTQDLRVMGTLAKKNPEAFNMKEAVNTDLIRAMQAVGAVREDVDPAVVGRIINVMSYGLVGIEDVVPADADTPSAMQLIEFMGEMLDAALTPPNANLEAGKAVIAQIIDAARQQLNNEETQA